ncbi:MAG: hypothetical protein K2Q32_03465, partial [Alphaproteobacteria bacterium]|nr:hypothetical protein [Alphaproteobacteria bacterium]
KTSNDRSRESKERFRPSTSDNGEQGVPRTANKAIQEGARTGDVFKKAMEGFSELMTDPEHGTGQNIQWKFFKQHPNESGLMKVGDYYRNGCKYMGLCEFFAQHILAHKDKLLADVSPATKGNLATLIAAGAGDDYKDTGINMCKLGGDNRELGPQVMIATQIQGNLEANKLALKWPDDYGDMLQKGGKATEINEQAKLVRQLAVRQEAISQAMAKAGELEDAVSRKGGCDAGRQMKKAATDQGAKDDGKCPNKDQMKKDVMPAVSELSAHNNVANPGGSSESQKGAAINGTLGNSSNAAMGSPKSGCAGGGGAKIAALFQNEEFLAMINSKEFMVAYIDAPKIGEGSIFDTANIMIANAWEKYEGSGAFMYANLMLNQPHTYASNMQKYASLFEFKPYPFEKGNMIALKERDKMDPYYNFYTQRIEKPDSMLAKNTAPDVKIGIPESVVLSKVSLQDFMSQSGVIINQDGGLIVPATAVVPDADHKPLPIAEKRVDAEHIFNNPDVMKATLVSAVAQ